LNLPLANLLYCGGGHFYVLAPSVVERALEGIQRKIGEELLDIHRGELYLVLDWYRLSANDFQKEKFGKAWEGIGVKIARKKKRKFAEILEMHERIFGPMGEGGTKETCDICVAEEGVKEEEGGRICNFCKSLESLAKDIAKANYWIETWKKDIKISEEDKGSWKKALSKFGVEYEFTEKIDGGLKMRDADHIIMYKLNDTNFSDIISGYNDAKSPISFGFKFLAKNTPYVQKEIKDFGDFANDSEGIKRWAVLRADVDNLGKIFSAGLGEDRTISRVSNLSSMLSLFFRGWMEEICEDGEYKDRIYAIYSGGDDLFMVGSWDKIPEIGKEIYKDFRAFTCSNHNITLSAGITIAPSEKYPLYKAADLAREALDKSKGLKEKDGITFLEMPVEWNKFDGEITKLKEDLKRLLDAGVSRAFLQKLYEIYGEYEKPASKHGETSAKYDDRYGRWRWLLAYVIARTKVSKENKHVLEETEELIRKNIEYLPITVRWVEFLTRGE
jgi:CRISPR-associated protein Csm1